MAISRGSSAPIDTSMQAVVVDGNRQQVGLEQIGVPTLEPHEVLVKIFVAGLTPGVFAYYRAQILNKAPFIPGHEAAGVVAAVGNSVSGLDVGRRARLNPNLSCGHCKYCEAGQENACDDFGIIGFAFFGRKDRSRFDKYRNGVLAEYIKVPQDLVDVLPFSISFELGAKLYELANAHCVLRQVNLPRKSTVILTAPTGSMGACCLMLAEVFDIGKLLLVGRSQERCIQMEKFTKVACTSIGTDKLSSGGKINHSLLHTLHAHAPEGVDAIIDFWPTGSTVFDIIQALNPYGSLVHMSSNTETPPITLFHIMRNCWRILGSRVHCSQDLHAVRTLATEGRINSTGLSSHIYPLEQIDTAIGKLTQRDTVTYNILMDVALNGR